MAKTQLIRKAGEALGLGGRLRAAITGNADEAVNIGNLAQTFGLDILSYGV